MNYVVHMTECKPNSTIASARVARFIVDTLNSSSEDQFELVDTQKKAEDAVLVNSSIPYLFIVNGPMAFCDFLPALADLVRRAVRVIWVQQDYTIMPPSANSKAESPFRKVFADRNLRPDFWTTVKANIKTGQDQYVNWNQLTYDPQPLPPLSPNSVLMYYGAYREKREPIFIKYFANAPYPVHVSTTPIRGKKFKALDPNIVIVPPFTGLHDLPYCSASLYIEDPKSSVEFHSPANRFYELLSAGLPMFFDRSSLKMLAEAGIKPEAAWVVDSKEELHAKLKRMDLDTMRTEQRALWCDNYIGFLRNAVTEAWNKTKVQK